MTRVSISYIGMEPYSRNHRNARIRNHARNYSINLLYRYGTTAAPEATTVAPEATYQSLI